MSRSLVGSSSSSTLGSVSSSLSSWKRRRSPPDRSPSRAVSRSPVKPKRSSSDVAVISWPSSVLVTRRIASTVGSTRASGSISSSAWVRYWSAIVRPCLTRPTSGASAPEMSESSEVLPAPLTPTMPIRSPGPIRHVACWRSTFSPRARSTSSMSTTSLPSRWLAKRWSSIRSRGGGTSSMRALAASMRNFGFDVRAGGPRRSHASSLRARFSRRVSDAGGLAGALGLGQDVRRVAALVGVHRAVVDLPRGLADLVEEPAVVGHHDERAGQADEVGGEPGDRLDVEVVGRLVEDDQVVAREQQRRQRAATALAAGQPDDRAVEGDAGEQLLDDLAGGRVGGPLVVLATAEHRLADAVGVDQLVALVEVADLDRRGCARRDRRRAPRGRSSPRAGWSCRRRCARRRRPAPPPRCRGRRRRAAAGRRRTSRRARG